MNKCKTEIGLIEIYADEIPNISQLLMMPSGGSRGPGSNAPQPKTRPSRVTWLTAIISAHEYLCASTEIC